MSCFNWNNSAILQDISTIEQPVEMHFGPSWQSVSNFTNLFSLYKPTVFHCGDIFICNNVNRRNHYDAHSGIILTAYFTTWMYSENFKMLFLVSTSPKLHIGTKRTIWKWLCPLPLNFFTGILEQSNLPITAHN